MSGCMHACKNAINSNHGDGGFNNFAFIYSSPYCVLLCAVLQRPMEAVKAERKRRVQVLRGLARDCGEEQISDRAARAKVEVSRASGLDLTRSGATMNPS